MGKNFVKGSPIQTTHQERSILFLSIVILFIGGVWTGYTKTVKEQQEIKEDTSTLVASTTTIESSLKRATTTVFWIGEDLNPHDNVSNSASAWDINWRETFGGTDHPEKRCGFHPCAFTPNENPFYVALPFNEFDQDGSRKAITQQIPWYEEIEDEPLLKNHWVMVIVEDKTCYGQWQDVGPGGSNDFDYVFGDATEPLHADGLRAGLDISPALRDCLELDGISQTNWRFVDEESVPDGPWREIVTTSSYDSVGR